MVKDSVFKKQGKCWLSNNAKVDSGFYMDTHIYEHLHTHNCIYIRGWGVRKRGRGDEGRDKLSITSIGISFSRYLHGETPSSFWGHWLSGGLKISHMGLPLACKIEWLTQEATCLSAIVTSKFWLTQSCWNCTQGTNPQFVSCYKHFRTKSLLRSATTNNDVGTTASRVSPALLIPLWPYSMLKFVMVCL